MPLTWALQNDDVKPKTISNIYRKIRKISPSMYKPPKLVAQKTVR